jgi:hypothetical protein
MTPGKSKPAAPAPAPEGGTEESRGRGRSDTAGSRARASQGDARHDSTALKKNQERLGVGDDHKTDAMKKHRRGTFP